LQRPTLKLDLAHVAALGYIVCIIPLPFGHFRGNGETRQLKLRINTWNGSKVIPDLATYLPVFPFEPPSRAVKFSSRW
jgi:hypothetical protein